MKKIILSVLCLLLVVLTGCSSSDSGLAKNEKVLTQEEFKNCFTYIQLTQDNWKDYFELGEYTDPEDNRKVIVVNFKEENLDKLCGNPKIDFKFNYDYTSTSKNINADTKEVVYDYSNDDIGNSTRDLTIYPKRNKANDLDRYYYQDYITDIHYENYQGYDSWNNCNVTYVVDYNVTNLQAVSVSGTLCYANYSDEMFNTNSLNERYVCFNTENGTRYSLFENGLIRWDRGSGFGYGNGKDLYDHSYFDYFEND